MPTLRRHSLIAILTAAALWLGACTPASDGGDIATSIAGFTTVPGSSPTTPIPPTRTLDALATQLRVIQTQTASAITRTNTVQPVTRTATPLPPTATPRRATPVAPTSASGVVTAQLPQGFVAQKGFWQVYFTAPTGSRDASTYVGGIDELLAANIAAARQTVDMAAYEFNLPTVTRAVLDAARRGVRVRIVTDEDDGLNDEHTTLDQLVAAGIQVVADPRSALMHNKFAIIDSAIVWTGSWNYTINDTYRNNNNAIVLRSRSAVANFQAEFNEMFADGQFGPRSPENTPNVSFTQDSIPVEVYFAPETNVLPVLEREINAARQSIRFMAFSFTIDEMADAILNRADRQVSVRGIFETVGSETRFSELTPLYCGGLDVRQDGSAFILHHKVFIIDDTTVLTGSFNFSASATESNDENLMIIRDRDLAAQYLAEFERRWREARPPEGLSC
ncbi:MAG: phospholipase D-like domain-containing protein [bacterium]|nr:phospholipase D-like domain-containing protein [bacterium]